MFFTNVCVGWQGMIENKCRNSMSWSFVKLKACESIQFLFSITQKIHRTLSSECGKDASPDFPVLAGSHLKLKNPALEFVKYICKVRLWYLNSHIFFHLKLSWSLFMIHYIHCSHFIYSKPRKKIGLGFDFHQ